MKGSRNRRVGLVALLVALATALGGVSVATAGASTGRGAVRGRLGSVIVPVPPPSKKALHQAATDRRDQFVRPSVPSPSPAVSLPNAAWSPLGPAAIGPSALQGGGNFGTPNAGRVESPVTIPSGAHAGRIVIGTAGGGIFTSDDNGATWTARTDQTASLAIKGIAVDPSNPMHLIAGTGEAENCGDCYFGSGILSSSDGGTTWTLQDPGNVFFGLDVSQVAIDPSNSSHMFAATTGGLFVTTDGGATWATPTDPSYASNVDAIVTAVVIDPSTPATVYVASTDGNTAVAVAKSTDGGLTWAAASTGIPAAASGFAVLTALAIAPSSPTTLYASVGSTGPVAVYKTTNGAASWSQLTGTPDFTGQTYAYGSGNSEQGFYDNVIAVDPTNPSHVLAGGIAAIETTNGGATWTNTNGQNFFAGVNHDHPDHHGLAFGPDGKVLFGDDGGIYVYDPSSTSFTDLNGNLNDAQFYNGFNEVGGTLLAGMQDNASAQTTSSTISPWTALPGGDGGDSEITPNAPAERFITNGNMGLSITTDAFATTLNIITPPYGSAAFTPPFTLAPNTATPTSPTVYFGADGLYRTTNPTASSPTWTKVTTSPLGAADLVSAIAVSPTNPSVVYVGYQDGALQVSANAGATWTNLPPKPFTDTFITGISVDPTNQQAITVSVSYNNTRTRPGLPHVAQFSYTSSVGAGTWSVISGNLPGNAAVSRVVYDQGALIAATDQAVYGTTTPNGGSTTWSLIGTGLPNVQVQDLYVDPSTNDLYAVTHGRGAWKLPGVAPPAPVIISQVRGGAGGDNFVELYNRSSAPVSLAGWTLNFQTSGGSTGVLATLPSGASIAPNGYYLLADGAYSLTSYAAPDAPITAFANDDSIGLKNTAGVVQDGVRFGSEALYQEGSPLGTWPGSGQYAFVRKLAVTPTAHVGPPLNTGNNAADFVLVRPETPAVAGSALTAFEGSPGPHDTASQVIANPSIAVSLLCGANPNASPNRDVLAGGPVAGGMATRTLILRRTLTNQSATPITSLRFRVSDITTGQTPAPPAGQAVLRAVSSPATSVTGTSTGCTSAFPLTPMTLESPASANFDGGGLNASLTVPGVTAAQPLAAGASINVAFELGVVGAGSYRFYFNTEAK